MKDVTAREVCEMVEAADEAGTAVGDNNDCTDTDVIVFELSRRWVVELDVGFVLLIVVFGDVPTFKVVVKLEVVAEQPVDCTVLSVSNKLILASLS